MPQQLQRSFCQGQACRQCLPGPTGPATPGHWHCQTNGCTAHAVTQWLVVISEAGDTSSRFACATCKWPETVTPDGNVVHDERYGKIHQLDCSAPDRDANGAILCHCTWS